MSDNLCMCKFGMVYDSFCIKSACGHVQVDETITVESGDRWPLKSYNNLFLVVLYFSVLLVQFVPSYFFFSVLFFVAFLLIL